MACSSRYSPLSLTDAAPGVDLLAADDEVGGTRR